MSDHRRKLPDTRQSLTHKVTIAETELYINVGFYEDGNPGELFLTLERSGTTLGGMLDAFAIAISFGLQHGVPLDELVHTYKGTSFPPHGWTSNRSLPEASSIPDYVLRWMDSQFPLKQIPNHETDQPDPS